MSNMSSETNGLIYSSDALEKQNQMHGTNSIANDPYPLYKYRTRPEVAKRTRLKEALSRGLRREPM
jgi:hypothetical protein